MQTPPAPTLPPPDAPPSEAATAPLVPLALDDLTADDPTAKPALPPLVHAPDPPGMPKRIPPEGITISVEVSGQAYSGLIQQQKFGCIGDCEQLGIHCHGLTYDETEASLRKLIEHSAAPPEPLRVVPLADIRKMAPVTERVLTEHVKISKIAGEANHLIVVGPELTVCFGNSPEQAYARAQSALVMKIGANLRRFLTPLSDEDFVRLLGALGDEQPLAPLALPQDLAAAAGALPTACDAPPEDLVVEVELDGKTYTGSVHKDEHGYAGDCDELQAQCREATAELAKETLRMMMTSYAHGRKALREIGTAKPATVPMTAPEELELRVKVTQTGEREYLCVVGRTRCFRPSAQEAYANGQAAMMMKLASQLQGSPRPLSDEMFGLILGILLA